MIELNVTTGVLLEDDELLLESLASWPLLVVSGTLLEDGFGFAGLQAPKSIDVARITDSKVSCFLFFIRLSFLHLHILCLSKSSTLSYLHYKSAFLDI